MVLHVAGDRPFLGQFVKDKGRLKLRDRGLLGKIELDEVATCFDMGICGAISLHSPTESGSHLHLHGTRLVRAQY